MNTYKLPLLALIVSAVVSLPAQAGNRRGNGGNSGSNFASAPARASAPSFRSSPGGNFRSSPGGHFSSARMIAPSQRFSSVGMRATPATFRPRHINSGINSGGNASVVRRQFTPGMASGGNNLARINNARRLQTNPGNHFGDIQNARQNRLAQNQNLRGDRPGRIENSGANRVNANANRHPGVGDGRNHVFERRDGNWHRDWDRHCDHWWNGHRCRWVNNCWFIFDIGFFPWYGYPYYAYDYYPYPYGYDAGVYYGGDANDYSQDYSQGTYDSSNQYPEATVAAAQQQLARQGYYRGQIDGIFGPETQRAIMRYQRDHRLRVTGYLTIDTRESLGLEQVASYETN
jgi:hypothetical protein